MKISKIRYLSLGLTALALSLGACDDQVIDLLPESVLTEGNFYKTAQDLEGSVLGIYSRYQARLPRDWAMLEMPTDNLHTTGYFNIGGLPEVNNLAFTSDNPLFSSFWINTYNGIARANAVLDNIDTPTNYRAGQKEQLSGEARFMRGLFYFDLVRVFGGVPLVTTGITSMEAKKIGRATEEEIYARVIEDLKAAIELLPATGMAKGRSNKAAAVALLAKVYVFRQDWNNAKTYLDMMPAFGYSLLPDFAALWRLNNEDNAETIFAMKYIDGTNGQPLSSDFLPYFGVTDIVPRANENAFPSWDLHKLYVAGDKRKAATITESYKAPDAPAASAPVWKPYVSKFSVKHTQNSSGLDIPVIRYAEVLLLQAEVLYRLNQPGPALQALNQVRERAFGDASHNYTLADIATPEAFLDKLLLERRLELAFENHRWFDLVRTGRLMAELDEVETDYNNETQTVMKVNLDPQPHYKFFPIPNREIEQADAGVLVQNQGYN
ncbi:MAG: RagB/SusD family nutrient uptake outer membrane protein [Adhaeribacter sp.]